MRASLPQLKSYRVDPLQENRPKFRHFEVLLETWLLWLLVTGLIWPVGLFVLQLISQWFSGNSLHWFGFITAGVLAGGLISIALWPIMRPLVRDFIPWLGFSSVGWALGFGISSASPSQESLTAVGVLTVFFGGCVFGLSQWLTLKPNLRGSEVWVILAGISWPLALALGVLLQGGQFAADQAPESFNLGAWGVIGWPLLSILAFFIFITLFSKPFKIKSPQQSRMWE